MKTPFSLICLTLLVACESAYADGCPGPNTQTVRDAYFHFTYESWVKPPTVADSVFSYGRCAQAIGKGDVKIEWDKPQLKGVAAPDEPILITFPFALDQRTTTSSDLG